MLSLAASLAVGFLLVGLYQQSSSARYAQASADTAQGCQDIAERYRFYVAGWAGPEPSLGEAEAGFVADLTALIGVAIDGHPGLAGGIWEQDRGSLAASIAVDETLTAALGGLVESVESAGGPVGSRFEDGSTTALLQACPLRGPVVGLTAWAMARVQSAPGVTELRLGLGVLLLLALGMAVLLTWLVAAWGSRIAGIERALAEHEAGTLRVAPTGERELDRIVAALNLAGSRLAEMQAQSDALAARMALSERMAALGRVAAGVAHEIRNPIAAIRIRAENALAGDDARRRIALESVLAQVARLDRLIGELLAMTIRRDPEPVATDIAELLEGCAAGDSSSPSDAGTASSAGIRCHGRDPARGGVMCRR